MKVEERARERAREHIEKAESQQRAEEISLAVVPSTSQATRADMPRPRGRRAKWEQNKRLPPCACPLPCSRAARSFTFVLFGTTVPWCCNPHRSSTCAAVLPARPAAALTAAASQQASDASAIPISTYDALPAAPAGWHAAVGMATQAGAPAAGCPERPDQEGRTR